MGLHKRVLADISRRPSGQPRDQCDPQHRAGRGGGVATLHHGQLWEATDSTAQAWRAGLVRECQGSAWQTKTTSGKLLRQLVCALQARWRLVRPTISVGKEAKK